MTITKTHTKTNSKTNTKYYGQPDRKIPVFLRLPFTCIPRDFVVQHGLGQPPLLLANDVMNEERAIFFDTI